MYAMDVCGACGGQERGLGPLELALKMVVAAVWKLRTKPRSTGRAASALNQRTISPAPGYLNLDIFNFICNNCIHVINAS